MERRKPVGPRKKSIEALQQKTFDTYTSIYERHKDTPRGPKLAYWHGMNEAHHVLYTDLDHALFLGTQGGGTAARAAHLTKRMHDYQDRVRMKRNLASGEPGYGYGQLDKQMWRAMCLGYARGYTLIARELERLLAA